MWVVGVAGRFAGVGVFGPEGVERCACSDAVDEVGVGDEVAAVVLSRKVDDRIALEVGYRSHRRVSQELSFS
jgi:hypothetical protein